LLVAYPGPTSDAESGDLLAQLERSSSRRQGAAGPAGLRIVSPVQTLTQLRAVKSSAEIDLLQQASWITREAHKEAMRATGPGMNEFEIQALIEYSFRRNGSHRPGFNSIVGSGPNSTILHYSLNERFMEAGDMLVMDIGATFEGYTTDITRSIPVAGRFTVEQRAIYELVLEAQLAAERLASVAGTPFRDLSVAVQEVFGEGLTRLGLIESADATLPGTPRSQVGLFYMHGLGHGIGLDVHDSMTQRMEPGTCFTIEPGLYIRPDALDRLGDGPEADLLREKLAPVVARYANIGVRIENSYAFTEAGLVNLAEGIPRTVEEVEAMMAEESVTGQSRARDLVEAFRRYRPPIPPG
jgi:Xaa-Pro aminopeptidase